MKYPGAPAIAESCYLSGPQGLEEGSSLKNPVRDACSCEQGQHCLVGGVALGKETDT